MNTQIEKGYRFLRVGEIIQNGDEFQSIFGKKWHPVRCTVGESLGEVNLGTFRRKIAAEAEVKRVYRLLVIGEFVKHGDEVYDNFRWRPAREGVVTKHDAPIRRVIFDYLGGPA